MLLILNLKCNINCLSNYEGGVLKMSSNLRGEGVKISTRSCKLALE